MAKGLYRTSTGTTPGSSGATDVAARHFPSPEEEKRILVVDDYESVLDVLSWTLSRIAAVETASNGKEAMARIRGRCFDLIVSDVDMPEMNGIELYYEAVREVPALEDRFLFFTGSPTPASLAFFRERQVPFMTKPARPHEIERAVTEILDHHSCPT